MDFFYNIILGCQYTMTLGADMKTARERIVVKRTKTTRQSLSITCSVKVTENKTTVNKPDPPWRPSSI